MRKRVEFVVFEKEHFFYKAALYAINERSTEFTLIDVSLFLHRTASPRPPTKLFRPGELD
jgi:hypothetical protein